MTRDHGDAAEPRPLTSERARSEPTPIPTAHEARDETGKPPLVRALAYERVTIIPVHIPPPRPEPCSVCETVNPRCAFGHPDGVCTCWRGIPCTEDRS